MNSELSANIHYLSYFLVCAISLIIDKPFEGQRRPVTLITEEITEEINFIFIMMAVTP